MDRKVFTVLFYSTLIINLLLIISYLSYPIIGDDSGFYLSIARELYEGKIYFHEIGISYNPLSIVLFGLPYLFAENPGYAWHLCINIFIVISSSVVFYNILKLINPVKIQNLFFSSFLLTLCLVLDGKYIMLEPLSVFFQLMAILFYLNYIKEFNNKILFWVGVFVCLAFLSKQYGMFIALPIGMDILRRKRFKSVPFIILGFIVPLGMFFSYLLFYGVSLLEFMKHIIGKGLDLDIGNGTGISTSFFSYYLDTVYILLFNSYVLIIPFLLLKYFYVLNNNRLLFIVLAITSLSVLYFANYWHYYQYIVPFWLLLFVYLFQIIKGKNFKVFISTLFSFSIVVIMTYSLLSFLSKQESINKQEQTKMILNANIKPNSEVYLDGLSPAYYYLCNFNSIDLKNISYTFPGYFFPETIMDNLKPEANLIISKDKVDYYKKVIDKCNLQEITIENSEYIIIKKAIK